MKPRFANLGQISQKMPISMHPALLPTAQLSRPSISVPVTAGVSLTKSIALPGLTTPQPISVPVTAGVSLVKSIPLPRVPTPQPTISVPVTAGVSINKTPTIPLTPTYSSFAPVSYENTVVLPKPKVSLPIATPVITPAKASVVAPVPTAKASIYPSGPTSNSISIANSNLPLIRNSAMQMVMPPPKVKTTAAAKSGSKLY